MNHGAVDHLWALVLAAGDGTRLKALTTTPDGIAVPKQYCSLHGGPTLLENALSRAEALVAKDRICTVVSAQHRRWWEKTLSTQFTIVQPRNCGTAIGVMLPVLHLLHKDPQACVVLLPSDHHVHEERVLAKALLQASKRLAQGAEKIVILGIEPEEADSELGYILPATYLGDGAFAVASFIEKPPLPRARELLAEGALWNTFIVAAPAQLLVNLFAQRYPGILEEMQDIVGAGYVEPLRKALLEELYGRLPTLDFSRHILEDAENLLEVLSVPACGWTDLGTPKRVSEVLKQWKPNDKAPSHSSASVPVTLAVQAGFLSTNLSPAAYQEQLTL